MTTQPLNPTDEAAVRAELQRYVEAALDRGSSRARLRLFADPGFAAIAAVAFAAVSNNATEYSGAADRAGEILEGIRAELGGAAHVD